MTFIQCFFGDPKVVVHMSNTSTEASCFKLIFMAAWTRCRYVVPACTIHHQKAL